MLGIHRPFQLCLHSVLYTLYTLRGIFLFALLSFYSDITRSVLLSLNLLKLSLQIYTVEEKKKLTL